jgi:hypothetical protein
LQTDNFCCPAAAALLQEKNIGSDLLKGRVGRIYMPKQTVDKMALAKPKGLKRERREAAAEKKAAKHKPSSSSGDGSGAAEGQQ